jgi:hypothetical protein
MAMNMTSNEMQQTVREHDDACLDLYHCELALHDAHQTRDDHWISAAGDRLHRAVVRYERARTALQRRRVIA